MVLRLESGPARVRIAPSPTGDPHVGTAYIALFNKAIALKTGGVFVLRIEDTDRVRYCEGSERMIIEALAWLGLDHDEGPVKGGPHGPYRQSERTAIYREAVDTLLAKGRAYRCFCTTADLEAMRERQKQAGGASGYDGTCRRLADDDGRARVAAGGPHVVRLIVPREGDTTFDDALRGEVTIPNAQVDDQVLLKSDGFPTYHLANVVDDHEMGITHVVRAEEWISSTPKHVLLYDAFGWARPVFCHMPLLRNDDKNRTKISKRKNPVSLIWYREQGFLPEALLNFLGLMGYSMPDEREVFSREEFFENFDPSRLKTTGPVFDLTKLEWLNGEWIRRLGEEEIAQRIIRHAGEPYASRPERVRAVVPLVQPRIKRLSEWSAMARPFFFDLADYNADLLLPKKVDRALVRAILKDQEETLRAVEPFAKDALEAACKGRAEVMGLKVQPYYMVLRVAATGSTVSPPLFESLELFGRETSLARLDAALKKLGD